MKVDWLIMWNDGDEGDPSWDWEVSASEVGAFEQAAKMAEKTPSKPVEIYRLVATMTAPVGPPVITRATEETS